MTESKSLSVTLTPLPPLNTLRTEWETLEKHSDVSFFQTWLWIGTWLACLPDRSACGVLRVTNASGTCGLAVVTSRVVLRHRILRVRRWNLNETGVPEFDALTIEYNGVMADRAIAAQVHDAVSRFLADPEHDWEEFYFSGMVDAQRVPLATSSAACVKVVDTKPYFFVDLDALRTAGQAYLPQLSSNTRSQVRQTLRAYEKLGPLQCREAATAAEAMDYLTKLQELHTAYWKEKGRPGAFGSSFQNEFHRRLVAAGVVQKRISLVRITVGDHDVGYLYNLVHDGHVYSYQSGFVYDASDAKLRPGLVSHYLALEQQMAAGGHVYDFLAGDARYKRSLSTRTGDMVWLVWQKPRLKFRLEDFLAAQKRGLKNMTAAPESPAQENSP